MKTRSVEAELFHTDGQTERHDEVNSRLRRLRAHAYKFRSLLEIFRYSAALDLSSDAYSRLAEQENSWKCRSPV